MLISISYKPSGLNLIFAGSCSLTELAHCSDSLLWAVSVGNPIASFYVLAGSLSVVGCNSGSGRRGLKREERRGNIFELGAVLGVD